MSTHAIIAKKEGDKYVAIYCHHDGYPEHMVPTLKKYWDEEEKVRKLIGFGNTSFLENSLDEAIKQSYGVKAYTEESYAHLQEGVENGEEQSTGFTSLESLKQYAYEQFAYLYIFDGRKWVNEDGDDIEVMLEEDD